MLLLGFLMLLRIFEANTTLNDATLFKLFQLDRYGWSSWIWNSHRLCAGSVSYAQHFGCKESNKVISFISDKLANIFERIYFMVIERLVISLIKMMAMQCVRFAELQACTIWRPGFCQIALHRALTFFAPKVLGFHFCGASRVVAHFSVTHFPRGAIPGRELMVSNLAPSSCHSKPPFGEVAIRNNPWYFCQVLRHRYIRFIKNVVKMQRTFRFYNFLLITHT